MKAKRIFALVLAAVLVLSLLTGCGGQQAPAASGSTALPFCGGGFARVPPLPGPASPSTSHSGMP